MPIVNIKAIIVWAHPGGSSLNTIGLEYDDATVTTQQAADELRDAVEDNLMLSISSNYTLDFVKVGDDAEGAVAISSAVGGFTQSAANPSVGFGITKVVGSGRNGRWFLPGVVEDAVDAAGKVRASDIATLNTRLAAFLTQANTAGLALTVPQKNGGNSVVNTFNTQQYVVLQGRRLARARG